MSAHRLNLKLLTIFVTVTRCQGYSRAQQALNMTLPAISGYMSELESQLGFVLCQRGRGGFSLTARGEQYLQYSLQLLDKVSAFERQIGGLKSEQGGTFSLGVVDSVATETQFSLADVIGQFSERFPRVYLNLSVRDPNELQQQILDNRLDAAVGHFPVNVSNLVAIPLYNEQHGLYCSENHPLFRGGEEHSLHQHRFVTRSYWNRAELTRRGFNASAASVESMEAQLLLILSGNYIGYLPEHCAKPWVAQGKLRKIAAERFSYQAMFSLIYRRGRSREPLLRAFRDEAKLRAVLKD